MDIYHTARAFVLTVLMIPFWLIFSAALWIAYLFEFASETRLYNLNPIATYKIVKSNNANDFNKWTGRRNDQ